MNGGDPTLDCRFEPPGGIHRSGLTVDQANNALVCSITRTAGESPENFYTIFSIDHTVVSPSHTVKNPYFKPFSTAGRVGMSRFYGQDLKL